MTQGPVHESLAVLLKLISAAINQPLFFLWCPVSGRGHNNGSCHLTFPRQPLSVHRSRSKWFLREQWFKAARAEAVCSVFLEIKSNKCFWKEINEVLCLSVTSELLYFNWIFPCMFLMLSSSSPLQYRRKCCAFYSTTFILTLQLVFHFII